MRRFRAAWSQAVESRYARVVVRSNADALLLKA